MISLLNTWPLACFALFLLVGCAMGLVIRRFTSGSLGGAALPTMPRISVSTAALVSLCIALTGIALTWCATWVDYRGLQNWIYILFTLGTVYAVIRYNRSALGPAGKTVEKIPLAVGLALLVVIPVWKASADLSFVSGTIHLTVNKPEAKVTMPANGDSPHFTAPVGYAPDVWSRDYESYWQCESGSISHVSQPKEAWCRGKIKEYWVHNLADQENTATIKLRRL